jgi:2'-phosphotransferase
MYSDSQRLEWIRKVIVRLGRYEDNQPPGFYMDRHGYFRVENLLEVWGYRNNVSGREVMDAIRSGMYQRDSTSPRFHTQYDETGCMTIKVYPKVREPIRDRHARSRTNRSPRIRTQSPARRGRSRSPRPKRMPRSNTRRPSSELVVPARSGPNMVTAAVPAQRARATSVRLGREERKSVSRTLSHMLRHGPRDHGVRLDSGGWCRIDQVLGTRRMQELDCTEQLLQTLVATDNKSRYQIEGRYIRAVQGHSLQHVRSDEVMVRMRIQDELPSHCVHGTYERNRESIEALGLWRCRNHIHFTEGIPAHGAVLSGMRHDCDLAVYIDLARAISDSIPFYRSLNGVILTPGIDGFLPVRYILRYESI